LDTPSIVRSSETGLLKDDATLMTLSSFGVHRLWPLRTYF